MALSPRPDTGPPKSSTLPKAPGAIPVGQQIFYVLEGDTNGDGKVDKNDKLPKTGGGGGGSGIKLTNDKPMVDSLLKQLGKKGFQQALNTKLANINLYTKGLDDTLLEGYGERANQLGLSRKDNDRALEDTSFSNLINRARERGDVLSEAALQGAGESDTLKSQMLALRNWDANQGEANRSFFDTMRSINSAVTDLNNDTLNARVNLYTDRENSKEQAYSNYYNQRADAYTQIGNASANPYSNQYGKQKGAYGKVAELTGMAYKSKGIPDSVKNWEGSEQAVEQKLNNTLVQNSVTNLAEKKPEGATLRSW